MATTIGRWTRHNLFASPSSSLLSLVSIPLTIYVGFLIARWAFLSAHWAVVADNLAVLLVGTFPPDQVWRAMVAGAGLSALFGMTIGICSAELCCKEETKASRSCNMTGNHQRLTCK